jgi:hypothetical protein
MFIGLPANRLLLIFVFFFFFGRVTIASIVDCWANCRRSQQLDRNRWRLVAVQQLPESPASHHHIERAAQAVQINLRLSSIVDVMKLFWPAEQ